MRLALVLLLTLSACASSRPTAPVSPAERYAGSWHGQLVRADETWQVVMTLRADTTSGASVTGTEQKTRGAQSVSWDVEGTVDANGLQLVEVRITGEEQGDSAREWCARRGLLYVRGNRLIGSLGAERNTCPPAVLDLERSN